MSPEVGGLASLAWPAVAERARRSILAVPLGATEQHGPHLPLSTDTDIAVALCERLAAARPDVLVAPPVCYGSSGEHAGFAGTISIGQAAVELLVVELVRSATDTFGRVLLVSAHGGNTVAVEAACRLLRAEAREVRLFLPRWQGEPHAGRAETSMMLALHPDRVDMARAAPGNTESLAVLWPRLVSGGVRSVSESGVLGDPTGADAEHGHALLDRLGADLRREVERWLVTGPNGAVTG
jgi:mycofactocin system creatininase family protein